MLQTPTITGTAGGSFTVTPATGLTVDPATGEFDPTTATTGAYDITYTTAGGCVGSETVNVIINPLDDATFNYSAATYSLSDPAQTPTVVTTGGSFSATPAGLAIDPSTGIIDPSTSASGTYTITHTTAGACPNDDTTTVTIDALDDASFNYSATSYCIDETSFQIPTITGEPGGTFTVNPTTGITIDPATGAFIPNATIPGTYDVTYTTLNPSQNSSTVSITITDMADASFNYSSTSYCMSQAPQLPNITGLAGGNFTVNPAAGLSIDPATGEIDPTASIVGSYDITYTTAGGCIGSSTITVAITALDDATFNYSAASYCVSDTSQSPTTVAVSYTHLTLPTKRIV